jgi:flagellar protein FlaJ
MVYFDEKSKQIVQYVSFGVGIVLFILLFITGGYVPGPPFWIPIDRRVNTGFALCFLLMMGAPALIEWVNNQFLNDVEENLPLFLRDITNEVQSGIPLMFALESASSKDYGQITKPLRQTMNRINVTSDIEGSLTWFGEQLVIPSAKRLSLVLIEAYSTGGVVTEILETSHEIFTVLSKHKSDREGLTNPYLYIVYLGTVVFLIISWVLQTKFLKPLAEIALDPDIQSTGLVSAIFNIEYYWAILFWAAVLEAIVGGLLSGKIKHGKLSKGLSYASILLLVTIVFFNSSLFR